MFKPELLAPAGNLEKLQTALLYGADAVYLGGSTFNLRASCDGFTADELAMGLRAAKEHDARIYYCVNSLPMEQDLAVLPAIIEEAATFGVHGFIVADPGVLRLVRRYAPGVEIHLSTQANTTNSEAIAFWAEQGVCRVNLARELSYRDIRSIRKACPDMELEVFVHGAMCLAVSGQCLLSSWLNNRPANLGRCTHPCRFEYHAIEAFPGQSAFTPATSSSIPPSISPSIPQDAYMVVEERTRVNEGLWTVQQGERYSSFWAPQDLCLLPYLPWFIRNQVQSLKIEGRMKGASYVAHVIDAYRTALDTAMSAVTAEAQLNNGGNTSGSQPGSDEADTPDGAPIGDFYPHRYLPELLHTASRPLGSGFFIPGSRRNFTEEVMACKPGTLVAGAEKASGNMPDFGHPLVARVIEPAGSGAWHIEVRGPWQQTMSIELMLPGLNRPILAGGSYGIENHRGERAASVGSGIRGILHTDAPGIIPGIFVRGAE